MNLGAVAGRRFAPHWLRLEVLERDGFRCRFCGVRVTMESANIDHLVAWPNGLTVPLNLVAACQPCNHAKGTAYVIPRPLRGSPWFLPRRKVRAAEISDKTWKSRRRSVLTKVHRRPIRDSWIREGREAGAL